LRCTPHRAHAFLDVAGLVDHQHGVAVPETVGDVVAQVIAHPVGVPYRPVEQVLHAVRIAVPGMIGDAPAVLTPEQEPTRPAAGLDLGEPACHLLEQPVGLGLPTSWLYPVAHDHRLII
jgi:hypothetical protein